MTASLETIPGTHLYAAGSIRPGLPATGRWGLGALVLALHAAVIAVLAQQSGPPLAPPPEPVFVRLIQDVPAPPAAQPAPAPEPVVQPPPRPAPRPEPKPVRKPEPKPEPVRRREPGPEPAVVPSKPPEPAVESSPVVPEPAAPAPQPAQAPPAPAAPARQGPREVSKLDFIGRPNPVYPRLSRRLGEEGEVLVRVLVDEQGRVQKTEVSRSSGYPRLDEAALVAVRRTRFKPHVEDGRRVAAWGLVPINFVLTD